MRRRKALITARSLAAGVAIVMFLAFSQANVISPAEAGWKRSLAGVWTVTFTPRSCMTGAPIPGAAFEGLYTFHEDGTMSAWLQNAFITVTRSPSHGLWERVHGWKNYAFKFVHLRYDLSGAYSGKQESDGTLVLNENGDGFTADGTTSFFDVDGNPLGGGCSGSVGTRFDL